MSHISQKQIVEKFYDMQDINEYDKSHELRYKHLISDLKLLDIKNSNICDLGCGSGYILSKLDKTNYMFGIDGCLNKNMKSIEGVKCFTFNLDYYNFGEEFSFISFDYLMSFETLEHITNPYHFIYQAKKMLKNGGKFYLSVPHEKTEHNTFYPSLIYPVENLVQFFEQMAFKLVDKRVHSVRFHQNVLILENRPWDEVKMKWPKNEAKFKGQPPHIQVNL